MNISAKTEYACIAVLELALNYGSGDPVTIRAIAETHGIPSRFLVQILLQLKGAGIVGSTRGAAGGYQLVRDPQQLTLAEVMRVIEGDSRQLTKNTETTTPVSAALFDVWQEVEAAEQSMLQMHSFGDMVEQVRGQTEKMYYI